MAGKSSNSQGKEASPFKAGRPAKMASGGLVEGVRQRAAHAMGGGSGDPVEQTPKGFQRKK